IRQRAGLRGVADSWSAYSRFPQKYQSKSGMRDIIRQERAIELAFERHRFFDVRRWKLAQSNFAGSGLAWNVRGGTPEEFYRLISLRFIEYNLRDVLWPIPQQELFINPNLVQNPGW